MAWGWALVFVLVLLAPPWPRRVVYRYLIYPFTRRNREVQTGSPWTPVDDVTASPDATERLSTASRDLAACGFVAGGHFRAESTGGAHRREAHFSMWLNEPEAIVARVIWARFAQPSIGYELTSFALSFTTKFDDGREVVTSNAPTVSPFRPDRRIDVVGWTGMSHVSLLYRLHRARAARSRGGRGTVMPQRTAEEIERAMNRTEGDVIERAIAHGYVRRDTDGRVRSTLRGSYLMTWRILWPWKQLVMAGQARRLRRVLAAFPEIATEKRALPPSAPAMEERIG
jgi:hypothetical protein